MIVQFQFPHHSFLYAISSILCSLAVVPFSIRLTQNVGLLDVPGRVPHKVHDKPVPLAGGTALILSLTILFFLTGMWNNRFSRAVVLASFIIYLFGLLDDLRGLSAVPKLTGQLLAGFILITSNISVHFVASLSLYFLSPVLVAWLDITLTLFWLVGVTNAMNMIDSMDGIAVGVSGIALLFFVLVTSLSGQVHLTEISIILLGITIGLYFFNVTPARLFLGDSGSQTFGFLIAAIAMEYAPVGLPPISSWFVPILLVGMPIFDTTLVVYSRLRQGLPIYKANLDHTYHRLVALGFDERRAVLTIHLAAILLSLIAFVTFYLSPVLANIIFGMILLTGVALIFYLDRHWRAQV